ncbi:MAG TPA: hypothetical protein VGL59_20130 [Polyangia bacterium]|jgi:hypothetical protein
MRLTTIALLATLVACHQAGLATGQRPDAAASSDAKPPTKVPANQDARSSSDSASAVDPLDGDAAVCAEQVQAANQIPVDLLFLVDVSGSMGEPVANGKTKYGLVGDALVGFFADRHSAGLGVALQFFPPPLTTACTSDADCGPPDTDMPPQFSGCFVPTICAPPHAPLGLSDELCSTKSVPSDCTAPASCMPRGYCSVSGFACTAINEACATGKAGDVCTGLPMICNGSSLCNPKMFHHLDVPFGDLPSAASDLGGALGTRGVGGGTPMGPAVQGALANLADRSSLRPDRPAALVLVTDGLPDACGPADEAIGSTVAQAAAATPPLPTYVIGVVGGGDPDAGTAKALFAHLAMVGGTGAPILVTPTASLSDDLLKALQGIRNRSLPCQFELPPTNGTSIDFDRVNVTIRGAAGTVSVLYAAKAERCDPTNGGWYYDSDPASGSVPRRIVACPATCDAVKSDPEAEVDLRFGCKTMEIP